MSQTRTETKDARDEATDYRSRLGPGGSQVDLETWAGSIPAASGITPRIRIGRTSWLDVLEFFGYRQSI